MSGDDVKNYHAHFEKVKEMRASIIQKLKEIRDDVKKEDKRENIGKIVYSTTGVAGGGLAIAGLILAPFTFGASLGLTVAGAAVGAASGGASISHGIARHVIVKNKYKEAERLLQVYKSEIEEFVVYIDNLLRVNAEILPVISSSLPKSAGVCLDVANFVVSTTRLCSYIRTLAPVASGVRAAGGAVSETAGAVTKFIGVGSKVASNAAKGLKVAGGLFAAISIVIDIGTIVDSGIELHRGKLSERAKQLDDIISELERADQHIY